MAKTSPKKRPVADPEWIKLEGAGPYADMVRVTTGERFVLLSFGQTRPGGRPGDNSDSASVVTVAQVYLPPKSAGELFAILGQHINNYQKQSGQRILPEQASIIFGDSEA